MSFSIETMKADYRYIASIKELSISCNQETKFDAIRSATSLLERILLIAEQDELNFKKSQTNKSTLYLGEV